MVQNVHFMHTREKDVFFLNALKVSLAPTQEEGPFHAMFVRKQHTQESKNYDLESEKKTFENDGQNATKITSALADSSAGFFRPVTSSFVEILCAYFFRVTIFLALCYCPFSSSVDVVKITIMTPWCFVNATSIWYSMKIEWNQQDRTRDQEMLVLTQSL